MSKKTRDHPSENERDYRWPMLQCLVGMVVTSVIYVAELPPSYSRFAALMTLLTTVYATACMMWRSGKISKFKVFSAKFWNLAGMFFDRKLRMRMYDPCIDEIREDFLLSRRLCKSRGEHAWLKVCFAKRGAFAFLRCLSISLFKPLARLIPSWLKHWWNLFG